MSNTSDGKKDDQDSGVHINPFVGQTLKRSPPRKRAASTSDVIGSVDFTMQEPRVVTGMKATTESEKTGKRDREEESSPNLAKKKGKSESEDQIPVFGNDDHLLEMFFKDIDSLKNLCLSVHTKTQKHIKSLISSVARKADFIQKRGFVLKRNEERKPDTQTKSTQTISELDKAIEEVLNAGEGLEALNSIIEEDWPKNVYKKTKMVGSNPEHIRTGGDFAIFLDPDNFGKEKLIAKLEEQYAGLGKVALDCKDEAEYLLRTSQVKTSRGKTIESSNVVYILPVLKPDKETVYRRMSELHKLCKKFQSGELKVILGEGICSKTARKVAEQLFRKDGPHINFLASSSEAKQSSKFRIRKEDGIITVKAGEKTYAEMMKTLKSQVDIGKLGINVKSIRKINKEDLQLRVEGGDVGASTLQDEIKQKLEGWEVQRGKQTKTTVFITGMDQTTIQEEVKEALLKSIKTSIGEDQIVFKSLKPGRFGQLTAIVEMPRAAAMELVICGRLKVGWVTCGVAEQVYVARCLNCLECGHTTRYCKSEAKKNMCFRCGQEGHIAKNCKNALHCIKCDVDGHRADHIRCPHFKKEVDRIRKLRLKGGFRQEGSNRKNGPTILPN